MNFRVLGLNEIKERIPLASDKSPALREKDLRHIELANFSPAVAVGTEALLEENKILYNLFLDLFSYEELQKFWDKKDLNVLALGVGRFFEAPILNSILGGKSTSEYSPHVKLYANDLKKPDHLDSDGIKFLMKMQDWQDEDIEKFFKNNLNLDLMGKNAGSIKKPGAMVDKDFDLIWIRHPEVLLGRIVNWERAIKNVTKHLSKKNGLIITSSYNEYEAEDLRKCFKRLGFKLLNDPGLTNRYRDGKDQVLLVVRPQDAIGDTQ